MGAESCTLPSSWLLSFFQVISQLRGCPLVFPVSQLGEHIFFYPHVHIIPRVHYAQLSTNYLAHFHWFSIIYVLTCQKHTCNVPIYISLYYRNSTETLIKRQTDWLKEFKQNVPLSSQLRSRRITTFVPSMPAPPLPASFSSSSEAAQETGGLGHLKLSAKPMLILDNRDKIQLVHV